jgi:hypothetical protein
MYSPDGQFMLVNNQWVPVPPNAASPPPPAPPPPPYQQQMAPMPGGPYAPPPPPAQTYLPPQHAQLQQQQQQQPWQAPPMYADASGDLAAAFPQGLDFNDPAVVGAGSLPEGDWIARFDDFEFGSSKATPPNPKVSVKVTITHGQYANRSGIYSYTLTEKSIFRLGKDLQKLNLGLKSNGQRWSTDPRTLAGELQQELRGKLVRLRVTPQVDKDTKLPSAEGYTNTTVIGWPDALQQQASNSGLQAIQAQQGAGAPVTAGAPPPQVTYPAAPPSNAAAPGYHAV